MAKGNSKPDGKITQLELFKEEPAETSQVEEQVVIKQTEEPAEAARPKKRVKNKAQETQSDIPEPAKLPERVNPDTPSVIDADAIPLKPADARQTEEKEAGLNDKFKKIQEERLAALRKARGVK